MPVSKRVRFEILRRDNHACRYCGATAPDVKLTVDHVVPVALGGSDDPSNLVTACAPCNSGKTSTSPDSTVVADVNLKALIWSNAMQQAAEERRAERAVIDRALSEFSDAWETYRPHQFRSCDPGSDWPGTVQRFLAAGLSIADLTDLARSALASHASDRWRYFCGCCWRRIREAQERAVEIATEWEEQARGE